MTDLRDKLADDIRFPNDWSAIKKLGGSLVCVRRPEFEVPRSLYDVLYHRYGLKYFLPEKPASRFATHESEFHWRDAPVDIELKNDAKPEIVVMRLHEQLNESAMRPED